MNPCGWDMIGLSVKVIVFRVCLDESGTDAVICCRKNKSTNWDRTPFLVNRPTKRMVKRCIYHSKKKVNELEELRLSRVAKLKNGKVENIGKIIKDGGNMVVE